jgi:hypothetical protein
VHEELDSEDGLASARAVAITRRRIQVFQVSPLGQIATLWRLDQPSLLTNSDAPSRRNRSATELRGVGRETTAIPERSRNARRWRVDTALSPNASR